jgi:pimeloyl-ACP methyl ester carboxylesterase
MPPRPYRIDVPDAVLDDLHERLARTRWAEPLPGEPWAHGAEIGYIRELCEYWRTRYEWRKHEAALNAYPQFMSTIDGLDIHYWQVRGNGPSPLPLMLVHGWPGSIFEFHHLIGPLTDPAAHGGEAADAFDVVIPALPGYGFGGKPAEAGWGPTRTARAYDTLMTQELGYARYGTQGGDWGSFVTSIMAVEFPERVIGAHLNMVLGFPNPEQAKEPEAKPYIEQSQHFQREETGYSNVHGTKTQSLGIAQSDSPAGLAAWIVEKFRTWSDCSGDVESVYTKDQLLTNIMFYWAPNSISSAANMYRESRKETGRGLIEIKAPVGAAMFPKELIRSRREWVEPRMNIQRWTEMPRGGHFAALEAPELLLEDVRAFFRELR